MLNLQKHFYNIWNIHQHICSTAWAILASSEYNRTQGAEQGENDARQDHTRFQQ